MTTVYLGDTKIVQQDSVQLWGIQGIPGCLYPTKMVAEIAARQRFPKEDESLRYARIFYKTYEVVDEVVE